VVLLAGMGLTLTAAWLQYRAHLSEASEQFSAWCEERQQRLARAIDSHVEVLYGMRALFDSSDFVSPREFDRYSLDAAERHVHIRSLGFLRHVVDRDRPQFEAYYSQLFNTHFSILDPAPGDKLVPAPSRPEYVPLVYAQGRERSPMGIDALPNPQMPAVITALRRGSPASAVIVPLNEHGATLRFVHVYLPVYRHPTATGTNEAEELYGYVRLRFVLEEMLEETVRQARAVGIAVTLTQVDDGVEDSAAPLHPPGDARLDWEETIPLADRMLLLQLRATDAYPGRARFLSTWPLLAVGSLLTLFAVLGALRLASSRMRSQDLTESLRQSEERYRVLVENSPDAILLYRQRRVVFANRAAIQLLGAQSESELVGRDILDLVHSDFRPIAEERIKRMFADQSILPPIEERLTRLDGQMVDVEVRTVPFIIEGEQVLQVAVRDITERREAERERAALEAALQQSQRLEAMGTFTGGIAHDFNNILSSIVGNIQLVLDDLPPSHPARQSAHEISNATNRARDLVKRLMTFSREQDAPLAPVALGPLVEEVQQLLRPTIPAGVMLRAHLPADTPAVIGNATQLHQVLVNLCTNAWQAMSSGRGQVDVTLSTLSAEEARSRSKVDLQGAKRYVCLEVRDNGSGIDPQIADRIFEPFFTTKGAGEGSGLGLAVVHGIVQSHNGAIHVTSHVGEGTSFELYLPASDLAGSSVSSASRQAPRGANQHVLYIDDEEPLVFLVSRVLERNGYRCTGMTDPRQAVELVQEDPRRFDLVISDMNMPGLSGIDVARRVLEARADMPVVITTGYVRAADVAATRALGVRDLVLKPDTIEELAALVGRYLQQPAQVS